MKHNKSDIGSIMNKAVRLKILIPAFNIPYIPMLEPIFQALEETDTFAIIEVSRIEVEKFGAKSFKNVTDEYRKITKNSELTSLHLDHIPVIDEDGNRVNWKDLIQEGLDLGFNSVMIDGSRVSLEENIKVTKIVVDIAHKQNIPVEAELGRVFGHEKNNITYQEIIMTKMGFTSPEEASKFVKETGVDWLSISCGNIHGAISEAIKNKPKVEATLDIEHIKKINEVTNNIPLVLHGGSGIKKESILEGVRAGISKINIGTEIRQVYETVLKETHSISDAQKKVASAVKRLIIDVYKIKNSAKSL